MTEEKECKKKTRVVDDRVTNGKRKVDENENDIVGKKSRLYIYI